ncbi:MAG TPA: TonB-dependent receptor [Ignavibacteriales bacterium]|nr:TonB-dependent receptor [Ignavibacteriales bacterium]
MHLLLLNFTARILLLTAFLAVISSKLWPQAPDGTGALKGRVVDMVTRQALPGVNVSVEGTNLGTSTDVDGNYEISDIASGRVTVKASMVGFKSIIKPDVIINNARPAVVDFELEESEVELETVLIRADYFQKDPSSAASITAFSFEEIRRAPGGLEDVVRALSTLPGIAQADAGRNDLVVRGGAPSENLYIIDGIPVANINHFGSQGSTGGPLSYIDLNFVKDVTFSTGGFPVEYGDKTSSVLNIDLSEGRRDRIGGKATVSATQFGLNAEGPLAKDLNFLFSARRSYLDFIFKAAGFGFVPEYYDVLSKVKYEMNNRNSLSFLFISAFDNVKFFNNTFDQRYSNSRTMGSDQIQYVSALSFRHLFDKGFFNISASRNFTDYRFQQRDTLQNPIFLNNSREQENNFQADLVLKISGASEISSGASAKLIKFNADVLFPYFRTTFGDVLSVNNLNQKTTFNKYSLYTNYHNRQIPWLGINAGLRMDYFNGINDPLTLSPRGSVSIYAGQKTEINLSAGIYYQSPSYIWLIGSQENRNLKSIKAVQYIAGVERRLREDTRLRVEAFYKSYSNYPASTLRPYLVLSNTGAGFGGSEDNFSSFALEALVSKGYGDVKGLELQMQKKSSSIPVYGIISLTYSQARFTALDGVSRPGNYDQRFIMNLSAGYIINDSWEASMKFRLATGNPYTPFNADGSQSVSLYNSERLPVAHSLDVRVDRRWNFSDWALVTFLDVQNVYNRKNRGIPRWDARVNAIESERSIGILPSIGVTAEF